MLVPFHAGQPGAPEERPIGRAALRLADEGIDVVFAHRAAAARVSGFRARPGQWEPVHDVRAVAAYDRYPSQSDPDGYARIRAGLGDTPVSNPMAMILLCRDKVQTQRVLEAADLMMPPIETDPARFASRLEEWGSAYLKPQFGAYGRGVRFVAPGDDLPGRGEGAVPGQEEPLFLQRAVPPLKPWRGVSVRILCQRTGPQDWHIAIPAVRRSLTDPVVNASRGAEVQPATRVLGDLVGRLRALAEDCCRALASQPEGDLLIEIGVDCVIDEQMQAHLIEVNSRPRGRLEALAGQSPEDFREAHVDACARPLRYLARAGC